MTTAQQAQADFDRLAAQWYAETCHMSFATDIIAHPVYQQIIAMGERAIPPILRDLEKEPKHWGPALHAITGAQPVPKEHAGRVREIAQDWLRWAKENGHEW